LKYGSVCSGIEAATCAWHPLGWKPQFFSEIDASASRFLKHKYPSVPNLGDMTKFKEWPDYAIDLLVGGTPCQSFSVAGLRKGLADPRGNLMLTYLAIADRYRPEWLVWENVPGVFSSTGHDAPDPCPPPPPMDMECDGAEVETEDEYGAEEVHAFNAFLAGLSELGYGWAYDVRDAQYIRVESHPCAVPQRRRRVFVVGCLGGWQRAAAVLFERESLSGHPPPRRQAGKAAPTIPSRSSAGGGLGTDFDCDGGLITQPVANPLTARMHKGVNTTMDEGQTMVAVSPTLRAGGNKTGGDRPPGTDVDACDSLVPIAFKASHFTRGKDGAPSDVAFPLSADADKGDQDTLIAFDSKGTQVQHSEGAAPTLRSMSHDGSHQNGGGQLAVAYGFQPRIARNGRGDTGDIAGALNAQSGETGKGDAAPHVAVAFAHQAGGKQTTLGFSDDGTCQTLGSNQTPAVAIGDINADAKEANAGQVLLRVRGEIGAEAFAEWGLGSLVPLQSAEILRSKVHGGEFRQETQAERGMERIASAGEVDSASWPLRAVREAERLGCASPGRELSEQCAQELGAYLQGVSHQGAPSSRFLHDLRRASEGLGVLREALSAVQEIREPAPDQNKPAHTTWAVRRLTPTECLRLMGFPDDYFTGLRLNKPFADGPMYKMLGNSMATNCMRWIGERIQSVAEIAAKDAAA
jgi:DNA (cytosine-5)-methyltransferase 1